MRRLLWALACLVVLVAPVVLLSLGKVPVQYAVTYGFLLGSWLLLACVGVAEIVVPESVLAWRRWMMKGEPDQLRRIGDAFDSVLGVSSGDRSRINRNLRILGVILIAVGTALIVFMWLVFRAAGLSWP